MLRCENLGRTLVGESGNAMLVDGVTAAFPQGQMTCIGGPSGSGKSSLLYLLGLLDVPSAGEVWLDKTPTAALSEDARAQLRLKYFGFVFQFHFLLPEFTVTENILMPMRQLGGKSEAEMQQRAQLLLGQLDMQEQAQKLPSQLSGGQRQRTAIARALANDPAYILADEPTGALDSKNSAAVFAIFHELAKQGRTVIVVTHDEHLAATAQNHVRLVDGRLV